MGNIWSRARRRYTRLLSHSVKRRCADQQNLTELALLDVDAPECNTCNAFYKEYRILSEIGQGGFGSVYRVEDIQTGETRAAKVLKKALIQDNIALLHREILIMKKIDNPYVLKLYNIYEDDNEIYIVIELNEGRSLFESMLECRCYEESLAKNLVRQIVSAVAHLHSIGIAHRDIKLENILTFNCDGEERIKIADFGLSRFTSDEERLKTSCGTPGYVAPEVLLCEPYDQSVDMWGIGVVTYILLSGYPPFFADSDMALFNRILAAEYNFDDEAWSNVSDLAKDFIRQLLIKDPSKRALPSKALAHPWLNT